MEQPYFKECFFCERSEIETVSDEAFGSWNQCTVCGRVVEERQPKLKHTTFSVFRWLPLEVPNRETVSEASSAGEASIEITPQAGKKTNVNMDGFVTCYSQMNEDIFSTDFAFSRSLAGDVIEMQKIIGDDLTKWSQDRKMGSGGSANAMAIGFVTIDDLCVKFGTPLKKIRAIKLFQRCVASSVYEQGTNFEALAVAAFSVVVCSDYKDVAVKAGDAAAEHGKDRGSGFDNVIHSGKVENRGRGGIDKANVAKLRQGGALLDTEGLERHGVNSLYDSVPASMPKPATDKKSSAITLDLILEEARRTATAKGTITNKEIRKHISMISNVLNNEPIVVEALRDSMSKYFKALALEKPTASLAAHIGNQAVKKNLCSRRNNSSLSAAAVYLACQLQGMRTTQHSFCKTVGLTEVTLRKVFKELKEHWEELVPANYKPFKIPSGLKSTHTPISLNLEDGLLPVEDDGLFMASQVDVSQLTRESNTLKDLDSTSYETSSDLVGFPIPKQCTLEGKYVWENVETKACENIVTHKPYPMPTMVYANVPVNPGGGIQVKLEPLSAGSDAIDPQGFPGFALAPTAGTIRSQIRAMNPFGAKKDAVSPNPTIH